MNKKVLIIAIVTLVTILLLCCSEREFNTPESVIYANAKYMAEENLSAVMSTIHPESPVFENTRKLIQEIFNQFDLNYKIERLEILEENQEEARVRFVQVTRKVAGNDFTDNRMKGIHTLMKDGDSWKIFSTVSEDMEYLF
jgi:uncharacterized protein YchJ